MKAYKVVEGYIKKDHGLFSIVTRAVDGGVLYKMNEWTKAQPLFRKYGYHLLVFKTLDAAQTCARANWWDGGIYECEAQGIIRRMPPMLDMVTMEHMFAGKGVTTKQSFPTGIVMARRVKLTRFVEYTHDGYHNV